MTGVHSYFSGAQAMGVHLRCASAGALLTGRVIFHALVGSGSNRCSAPGLLPPAPENCCGAPMAVAGVRQSGWTLAVILLAVQQSDQEWHAAGQAG